MQQHRGRPRAAAAAARRRRRSCAAAVAAPAPLLLLALACSSLLGGAAGLKVTIHPGTTECFTQTVDQEHFSVPGGPRIEGALFVSTKQQHGHPLMTVLLYAPGGELIWSQAHVDSESHFNVGARGPGSYKLCFQSHGHVDAVADLVYFTMGHLRRPGQLNVPKGSQETRGKEIARKDHLEDVKRNVVIVGELVDILSGEQRYLQRKLERHIQTCHSNNRRTLGYTLLEVAVLAGCGGFNAWFVSNLFKNSYGGRFAGRIMV